MDVEVPIVNYTNCKARYELGIHGKGSVFDRNFCAGAKGKDSCLVLKKPLLYDLLYRASMQ